MFCGELCRCNCHDEPVNVLFYFFAVQASLQCREECRGLYTLLPFSRTEDVVDHNGGKAVDYLYLQ